MPDEIKHGGNGLGTIVAVLIIAAAALYAINVWSTTRKQKAPGRNLEEGIERIKDAASKEAAERQ
ncbi:putative conserved membrane protein [Synechococcus sp. RS9915]|nr:putative conserved membrane protein [Synechococcus sp. RS9915]